MAQAYALKLAIPGQLETFERTETWGFRYVGIIFRLCEPLECQVFHKMVHDMIEESKDIFCQVIDALFGLSKVTLNCALLIPPLLAS